jgi:hypothetical protein
MTRAEAPHGFNGLVDEVEFQGLSVINSREPDEIALRFIDALQRGEIVMRDITKDGYCFTDYRKYSGIYPVSSITHMISDEASADKTAKKSGEFHGMFIAEQHRGSCCPSVLATAREVKPYRPGLF